MKRRIGFVSNSSSTSFCIVGAYFENEILEKLGEDVPDYLDDHTDQGNYGRIIGLSIEKMKDNMKLSEFKEEVKKRLNKFGLEPKNINIHIDGWYDG